jgi:CheY-like chemotaxis protein
MKDDKATDSDKNREIEGEPLTILLVEDNHDHAALVIEAFEEYHVANRIYHVEDGESALNYLMREGDFESIDTSPRPNLILLDLRLPKIDGLEVLKQIKGCEELRKIPVVILTTSDAEMDLAGAYECHANSYLVKPVDFEKFTSLMGDLGFYWLSWNRTPWNN